MINPGDIYRSEDYYFLILKLQEEYLDPDCNLWLTHSFQTKEILEFNQSWLRTVCKKVS